MAGALGATSHIVHFWGFAMAVGGAMGALRAHQASRGHTAESKKGIEEVAAALITKVELPGLFIALFGGILAIANNPMVMKPAASGAGPWLHIKLVLVLAVLVIAHLKMFRARRLVRERASGASEADCDALLSKAELFAKVDLGLQLAIFFLATFRFVLFA